jgi:hypothetical protein
VAVDRLPAARDLLTVATVLAAVSAALLVGVAVGNQDPGLLLVLGGLVALGILVAATFRPMMSFHILLTTLVTLPVFPVTESRGLNPADVVLLPALVGGWLLVGAIGREALPAAVRAARVRLGRATLLYLSAAALSLVALALRGHPGWAGDSSLMLFRFIQGILYFPLAERLLRTPRDIEQARNAIVAGFLVSGVVNAIGIAFLSVPRAGFTWNVAIGEYFISSPNELGFAVTFFWAILLALPYRNRYVMFALFVFSLAVLVATGSRSGLVSWLTFVAIWAAVNRKGWILVAPLLLVAIFPFLPESVFGRITRTLSAQRGSFEIYSTLVRVYAWKTAVVAFQHNPIFGVGYLCFRFVSHQYNALTLNLGTAENIILETAVGTGIIGLAAATWLAAAVVRLANAVRRVMPPGSQAHSLGRIAIPLFPAYFVANMTADNLVGMVSVAQVGVFCALLVAASRFARGNAASDTATAGA